MIKLLFLLFPSFFCTIINGLKLPLTIFLALKYRNPTQGTTEYSCHKSHTQHRQYHTTLPIINRCHKTRRSNNQITTSTSTWTPHQQVATHTSIYHGRTIPTLHPHSYRSSQTKQKGDGREKGDWKRIWVWAEAWKIKPNLESDTHCSKPTQVSGRLPLMRSKSHSPH